MKRLLDCTATDFQQMTGQQLKQAIRASEGRVMLSENMVSVQPLYPNVTNSELAAAFGADLILLNLFDVFCPQVNGLPSVQPAQTIKTLKHLVGRPIGINLEPVDVNAEKIETLDTIAAGRIASTASLQQAKALGFDFICLTGNPKTGVTNQEIVQAIKRAKTVLGDDGLIIAGKMHGAGVANETGQNLVSQQDIIDFIEAGADIILLAAPGTVPGMTVEKVAQYVEIIHANGALALLAIGTSQEGADEVTIRQIALNSKMAGADIYHIGDAGFYGIAVPENIMTYSMAIRGRRHTYVRMAMSINR
ncbi:hypothetical protein I926_01870 [Pasteurella multocida subsp. multocida OH4807]|nr:hypothetical protein I926_01870 [Pasteurella multocida subsp. multocida OH4807]